MNLVSLIGQIDSDPIVIQQQEDGRKLYSFNVKVPNNSLTGEYNIVKCLAYSSNSQEKDLINEAYVGITGKLTSQIIHGEDFINNVLCTSILYLE